MTRKKLEERSRYEEDFDLDHDGTVSDVEIDRGNRLLDLELAEEKSDAQRRMATCALVAIVAFTAAILSPAVSGSRVSALSDLMGLFYISMAGIVGAYMGVSAWMSKR